MVAFTPVYELPYQEGSDPPCFGPGTGCDTLESVWCDFVDIVEGQLDSFDNVVGRTASAIPMAKVSWTRSPAELLQGGVVPFDTVVFDTDNMVDSDNTSGITPRRDGVYAVDFNLRCTPQAANEFYEVHIGIGTEEEPNSTVTTIGIASAISRGLALDSLGGDIRASTLYRYTSTSPNPRIIVAWIFPTNFTFTVSSASMFVYWHSDF